VAGSRSLGAMASSASAPEPDLDLLAAALRADTGDLDVFVEGLAVKLEEAVPGRVRVQRRRAGLRGGKRVEAITLDAGEERLELRVQRGALETRCARLSGGIVLKSEALDTDAWLSALGRALGEEARRSEATRQALERLLI
jgi:hypothetical protein